MSSEPSVYKGFPVNPTARPAMRRPKRTDLANFSGTNDKALQRDGHRWAPSMNNRPNCRLCHQPSFIVEGKPCTGRKS